MIPSLSTITRMGLAVGAITIGGAGVVSAMPADQSLSTIGIELPAPDPAPTTEAPPATQTPDQPPAEVDTEPAVSEPIGTDWTDGGHNWDDCPACGMG